MLGAITLKQLSSLSGFSVSTVSKALNGRSDVNELTKAKIQEIAKSKNYVPNNFARALRNRKTGIIAVILPEISESFCNIFLGETQKKAFQKGYKLMFLQSSNCEKQEEECLQVINDGSVDGVIVLSMSDEITTLQLENKPFLKVHYKFDKNGYNEIQVRETANFYFDKLINKMNLHVT